MDTASLGEDKFLLAVPVFKFRLKVFGSGRRDGTKPLVLSATQCRQVKANGMSSICEIACKQRNDLDDLA